MTKVNGGYQSLFEYLVIKDYPFMRWLDERLYPDENSRLHYSSQAPYGRRWNPRKSSRGQQMLGSLQPIVDMGNDFISSFKPYKSVTHAGYDFLQPVRGVGNIAKGIFNLVFSPVLFLGNTIRYALISGSFENFAENMRMNAARTASWLMDGISSLIRGVTQIAATPLTWLIKMPLRGVITAFRGSPKIEENSGVIKLVAQGKKAVKDGAVVTIDAIRFELRRKFVKGQKSRQHTDIPADKENELFHAQNFEYGRNYVFPLSKDGADAALKYIGLFSTNTREKGVGLNADLEQNCVNATLAGHEAEKASKAATSEMTPLLK